MPNKKYDWDEIRAEYVIGGNEVTFQFLADKFGPALASLGRRASAESWVEQRANYRQQVADKSVENASTAEAEIRVRHIKLARLMMDKGIRALIKLDPDDLPANELRRYLKDAAEIERRAAGIPDAHEVKQILNEKMAKEIDKFLDDLEKVLPPDVLRLVQDALAN